MFLIIFFKYSFSFLYFSHSNILNKIINNSNDIIILNCIFKYFLDISGSCIFIDSSNKLILNYNKFHNCTSINYGGAIFKKNGIFLLNNCCFDNCTTSHIDEYFGNAIYSENNQFNCSQTIFTKCSLNNIISGDSTSYNYNDIIFTNFINFSYNYGILSGLNFYTRK